jgi:hypothetical protein
MNWIYVTVRTYPFWAIPLAISLLTALPRMKAHKQSKKKLFVISSALLLLASSAAFLMFDGPTAAVPFVHELLINRTPLPGELR